MRSVAVTFLALHHNDAHATNVMARTAGGVAGGSGDGHVKICGI